VAFDLGEDRHRLELIARPEEVEQIVFVHGDVTELDQFERVLAEHGITHVVHLAALQVPFCKADPVLGARVNVVGTVNVFEAAKRGGLPSTLAYASSAAVYDVCGQIAPRTHYGIYKLANEGTARIYWADDGVASVGLRPYTVYGPGRDQGLTSSPTLAMAAAARGEPYRISFGGRTQFHYAPDVARAFVAAARRPPEEALVFNLGGAVVEMQEVVDAIEQSAPEARGLIEFEHDAPLAFPEQLPAPTLDVPLTTLEEGVRETIEIFRSPEAA
jgi:nucleoside-diphosphate-sugar epimerase